MDQYVVFRLREEYFGVPIEQVHAIEKIPELTKIPQAPTYVSGMAELRGEVTTVIDLRKLLGIGEINHEHARALIVDIQGLRLGIMVDEAREVLNLDPSTIEDPPQMIGGIEKEYISGVSKQNERLLIVMNLEKVLNIKQVEEVKEVVEI